MGVVTSSAKDMSIMISAEGMVTGSPENGSAIISSGNEVSGDVNMSACLAANVRESFESLGM